MFQFSYNFNWKITLLSMNSAETGCITIFTFLPATPSTNMSRSKVTTLTHISLIQMSFVQWTTQVLACYLSLQMCQSHPVIHDGGALHDDGVRSVYPAVTYRGRYSPHRMDLFANCKQIATWCRLTEQRYLLSTSPLAKILSFKVQSTPENFLILVGSWWKNFSMQVQTCIGPYTPCKISPKCLLMIATCQHCTSMVVQLNNTIRSKCLFQWRLALHVCWELFVQIPHWGKKSWLYRVQTSNPGKRPLYLIGYLS